MTMINTATLPTLYTFSYLIYDVGTENGLLHVLLIRLDDTLDVVDDLLDFGR